MPRERLSMRKIREILRWKWELGRSHREVAGALGVSLGKVSSTVSRAEALGLDWAAVRDLRDDVLDARLHGPRAPRRPLYPRPDFLAMYTELKRVGVTLELLHHEYRERQPGGYSYSRYCELYREWLGRQSIVMRQEHRAGEKMFVDYSGKKPALVDRRTGELIPVELFIAVLGASNLTFAEATATQRSADFLGSHVRAWTYFGGVTVITVPDQLRSGVSQPDRYEPGIQRSYADLAEHYGTAVIPARPRKPRDKAKAEAAVLVVQRWILARLRDRIFFTLDELNEAIAELLEELNARKMRRYGMSRRELFEKVERAALLPLPGEAWTYAEWRVARVNIDYHVEVDRHYYSVPHSLRGETVEIRLTARTVEILTGGERVASHVRSYRAAHHTTVPEHMPKSHRAHLEWTPSRLVSWAASVGPKTAELVQTILKERRHPEQGYRSCLGILRLQKQYGADRLEAACARAVGVRARSYRHVGSILKNGLDRMPLFDAADTGRPPVTHENIRGPEYYQEEIESDADAGDDGEAERARA